MTKRELWSKGLTKGQEKFGYLSREVRDRTYDNYLACHDALQDDSVRLEDFKEVCGQWWRSLCTTGNLVQGWGI